MRLTAALIVNCLLIVSLPAGETTNKPPAKPRIDAKVTAHLGEERLGTSRRGMRISIDKGKKDGVTVGMRFRVQSEPDKDKIAVVDKVKDKSSECLIEILDSLSLEAGEVLREYRDEDNANDETKNQEKKIDKPVQKEKTKSGVKK